MKVKVALFPVVAKTVELPEGSSVRDALKKAEMSADGYEIKINGKIKASLDDKLGEGDQVMLLKPVVGNA